MSRMGSGSSALKRRQEDARIERPPYGVFKLLPAEEQAVRTVTDLLTKLMGTDTVFSLESVLKSNGTACSSLFIAMSSTLEQEFQLLRFPDPSNPGITQVVSFMPTKTYTELATNPSGVRRIVCEQIGFFAIRFVTLVAALAASISVNPATANVLYSFASSPKTGKFNSTYGNPVLSKTVGGRRSMRGGSLSASVLNTLRNPGGERSDVFRPVRVGEDIDERELYYFEPYDSVVIDTKRDIVYNPRATTTAVLRIEIEPFSGTVRNMTRNIRGNNFQQAQRLLLAQQQQQLLFGDPRYRGGGNGKTRKASRRQRGGADILFKVSLYQYIGCSSGSCSSEAILVFIMNQKGITYDSKEYMNTSRLPQSKSFKDRVQEVLNRQTDKVSVEMPATIQKEAGTPTFSPISKIEEPTLNRFKSIRTAILGGSAPSNDRAFLLASTLGVSPNGTRQTLKTMVCDDKIQGLPLTSSVAYSLLQSLYEDLPTGDSDFNSAAECSAVVQRFVSEGLVELGTPGSAIPTKLNHLKFKTQSKSLASSICSTQSVPGPRSLEIEDLKQSFMTAYIMLRDLYDAHVQRVIELLQKLVNFGTGGSTEIALEKLFVEHPAGAQVALNSMIHDARALLSDHYFKVESVYQGVLRNLEKVQKGQLPNMNKTNRLDKMSDKLKKELY